jgi:PAS domain S-box-containing protein
VQGEFSSSSSTGKDRLRVLFFEDNPDDVALSLLTLRSSEFEVVSDVAANLPEFQEALRAGPYDIILSDYRVPCSTGMDAFEAMKAVGLSIPFILVTGSLGDERAVECLKEGVADYVLKDRLARLPVAIRLALEERRLQAKRTQAEETLRRSEASYRSLIQSAPCGILRLNAEDGRLLEANPALAEMLGYDSPADLLLDGVSGQLPGRVALDLETCRHLIEECEKHERVKEVEVEWARKDGVAISVRLMGRLLKDDLGTPACFEMIAENATERRRAEQRIRQLNRLYSVMSHAGQTIVRIRERNELFREICRIVVQEGHFRMAWVGMVRPEVDSVKPVAHWGVEEGDLDEMHIALSDEPNGRGPVGTSIRENTHVLSDDVDTDPRMSVWRERALRWGFRSMGAFPLRLRGNAIGAIAIYAHEPGLFDSENVALLDELAEDVSFALESMEAQKMHRLAVDELDQFFALSLDMLCIVGMDGYIRRLNSAWEKTLGFTAGELRARPLIDFVHEDDRADALAALRTLRSGAALDRLEVRCLSNDGTYKWLIGSVVPVAGRGVFFAAVRDISDRRRLEEQLRGQNVALERQNRTVEAASRMKSEFVANMSHELRSPLNGIIGFSEMLYDGKLGALTAQPKEFLGRIQKSARHLLNLINNVLDLSKVEAGQLQLWPERVSVSNIVQEVTGILGTLAADKHIRIETDIEPTVDDVITDAGRLKQVLHNYLSNALKFTGEKGLVTVGLKAEGATEFRLEVSDTGVGIAEKDIPRLFTEFQQLDSTFAKRYQGTGLGLALTKRIVEAQGGRAGVRSELGKGSTFFVILPRGSREGPPAKSLANNLVLEQKPSGLGNLHAALERAAVPGKLIKVRDE